VFIPTGVRIGKNVRVGPGVVFTNDKYATVKDDWKLYHTTVGDGATIGAGSVIVPGITIGRRAFIGAGSVVTRDIPANAVAYGNPARIKGRSPA
jgi:acetyltransferase-like isoleucine patch superfamily enzyme